MQSSLKFLTRTARTAHRRGLGWFERVSQSIADIICLRFDILPLHRHDHWTQQTFQVVHKDYYGPVITYYSRQPKEQSLRRRGSYGVDRMDIPLDDYNLDELEPSPIGTLLSLVKGSVTSSPGLQLGGG